MNLTLPARGQLQVEVNGGVGEVVVMIPRGMATSIWTSAGIGSIELSGGYQRQGNSYVSPGYDTAQDRVDLRVTSGVGRISIREEELGR